MKGVLLELGLEEIRILVALLGKACFGYGANKGSIEDKLLVKLWKAYDKETGGKR